MNSRKQQTISHPAAIGFILFCMALGVWTLGYYPQFWSRPISQEDMANREPRQPGGMPGASRTRDDIAPYAQARGVAHIYNLRSILTGAAAGGFLGLLGISLLNAYLKRKPRSDQPSDEDSDPPDPEKSTERTSP